MLQIPGYYFDEVTQRYFKGTKPASTSLKSQSNTKKDIDEPIHKSPAHVKRRLVRNQARLYDDLAASSVGSGLLRRASLRHALLTSTLSRLSRDQYHEPDLTLGDAITRFTFKSESVEDAVFYGTSFGHVGHGFRQEAIGSSAATWRADPLFLFNSVITSLNAHGDWLLATCFGPQAKAMFSNTGVHTDGVSVTMAPKKTSLWSSSMYNGQIALGCDKQILYSSSPVRSETRSFGTGSAVFALHQHEYELLAGTRSGHLRFCDLRTASARDAGPEMLLYAPSSITHVKPLPNNQLLTALMNGDVGIYDRRFLSPRAKPMLALKGHVNTHSTSLGLDVWQDKFLAAAGEDNRVRIWSLRTGEQVRAGDGLTSQTFEAPVTAVAFRKDPDSHVPMLWLADGCQLVRYAVPV